MAATPRPYHHNKPGDSQDFDDESSCASFLDDSSYGIDGDLTDMLRRSNMVAAKPESTQTAPTVMGEDESDDESRITCSTAGYDAYELASDALNSSWHFDFDPLDSDEDKDEDLSSRQVMKVVISTDKSSPNRPKRNNSLGTALDKLAQGCVSSDDDVDDEMFEEASIAMQSITASVVRKTQNQKDEAQEFNDSGSFHSLRSFLSVSQHGSNMDELFTEKAETSRRNNRGSNRSLNLSQHSAHERRRRPKLSLNQSSHSDTGADVSRAVSEFTEASGDGNRPREEKDRILEERRAARVARIEKVRKRVAREKKQAHERRARQVGDQGNEKARRQRMYDFYVEKAKSSEKAKDGRLSRKDFKKLVKKARLADVQEADVDLLPWKMSGSLHTSKLTKLGVVVKARSKSSQEEKTEK